MQLSCDVINALVVAQYPFRDRLAHLSYETLHIEILEHATDDSVREKVGGCQRQHQARCDVHDGLEKVCRILQGCQKGDCDDLRSTY